MSSRNFADVIPSLDPTTAPPDMQSRYGSVSQMGKLRGYLTAHSTLLEERAGLCVLFLTVLVDSLTMGKAVSQDSDFTP